MYYCHRHTRPFEPNLIQKIVLTVMTIIMTATIYAQNDTIPHWYAGVGGGIPLGYSTARPSSAGYSVTLFGGRQLNRIFAIEASATIGRINMTTQQCCYDYWIDNNGTRYDVPVIDGIGWDYSDIDSRVTMQKYTLQSNVEMINLFCRHNTSQWFVELSPQISAIATHAQLRSTALQATTDWSFGLGGAMQIGYRINNNISLALTSALTHLWGHHIDGLPRHLHHNNFIWENGIRISWNFNKPNIRGRYK